MCGISGAISIANNVVPMVVEGLRRLEYRGYDSVGIAALIDTNLKRIRVTTRVQQLKEEIDKQNFSSKISIGHTRWATHGKPSEKNAHPQFSNKIVGVVHNGIIENHVELRHTLEGYGYKFSSDTDTEVIAHLINHYNQITKSSSEAVMLAVDKLKGQYAIGIIFQDNPDQLIVSRQGSPLVIGLGTDENYFASDVSALLPFTTKFIYLEDGDCAIIATNSIEIFDKQHKVVVRQEVTSEMSAVSTELGIFRHFMHKEIFEQPNALTDTMSSVLEHGISPNLYGPDALEIFSKLEHVTIIACGTSYHAGLTAKNWIEEIADVPVSVEIASEFICRKPATFKNDLVIAISQSGETADTIAAVQMAKSKGAKLLSICNVPESMLTRISDMKFMTKAGPEIGVASTKAFTTQLLALKIFAYTLAKAKGIQFDEVKISKALRSLPRLARLALSVEPEIFQWAKEINKSEHAIFLGRGPFYAIAEEGSLKLKEVSYIHAEAYPSGELKHGPLALIDDQMPIVMIIPNDHLMEKNMSSLQEITARCGKMFVIAQSQVDVPADSSVKLIKVPTLGEVLDPIAAIIPLQLLAYHTALLRGTDIDKPRNLAKSVSTQ